MLDKILLSAGLSFIIFSIIKYIGFATRSKVLKKINKNILMFTVDYFSRNEIKNEKISKFKNLALAEVEKMTNKISDFNVRMINENKLAIAYRYSDERVSYEISKEEK